MDYICQHRKQGTHGDPFIQCDKPATHIVDLFFANIPMCTFHAEDTVKDFAFPAVAIAFDDWSGDEPL